MVEFDSVDILNRLRHKHAQGGTWFGVDVATGGEHSSPRLHCDSLTHPYIGICDTYKSFVWEPTLVKSNAIVAATEAACLILSVDETVRNPRSEQNQ